MYTYLEQKAPKFCYFLEYYGLQYSCSSLISFLAFPRHLNVFYNPLGTNECIQIAAASNQLAPSFYAQCSLKMEKQCDDEVVVRLTLDPKFLYFYCVIYLCLYDTNNRFDMCCRYYFRETRCKKSSTIFFQILEHCVYRVHGAAATAASKVELFDVMSL